MKTRISCFAFALCAMLMIGLWLTIAVRGGRSISGGFVQSPPPVMGLARTGTVRTTAGIAAQNQIAAVYGKLPLSFEANRGQADPRIKFLSRGHGYGLWFTSREAILSLGHATAANVSGPASGRSQAAGRVNPVRTEQDSSPQQRAVLRIMLAGANPAAGVTGLDELPGKANYFLGNDPKKWRTNVPTYGRVKYDNVYPGVDLVYYGNQRDLESDFVVAPGADPGAIRLKFRGTRNIRINRDGDLVLKIHGRQTILRKPVAYQPSDDDEFPVSGTGQRFVAARYVLKGQRVVGFAVEGYDNREPLIIDPVLAYSTYLGGSGIEQGVGGIAVDAAGNAYVTGVTGSTDFPTVNPFQSTCRGCSSGNADTFVTKLNPDGNVLVYSTYLGGSIGVGVKSIAVDAAGNAYLTGNTSSPDFPTANPFQATLRSPNSAFVTKLNATGNALVYSTYLGGTGGDYGAGIAVDPAGSTYVTGFTFSTDFPTMNPFQSACGACSSGFSDAFVTKFSAAGNALVYSTYLGGSVGSQGPPYSQGGGVAVDTAGSAYVTGQTNSTNFPTMNPFQSTCGGCPGGVPDAFVTKFNAAGDALVYSTYLGGSVPGPSGVATSVGSGIAVDASGNAYATGETMSTNFPTANPFQAILRGQINAFVTQFNPAGDALVYSSYLGGSSCDAASGIAVDAAGNASVAGGTTSTDFPLVNPFQSTCDQCACFGNGHAFVTQFNSAGNALVYSSYLGGSPPADGALGIAVDAAGNAYVVGTTLSTDFPTVNPVQPTYGGNGDDFVAKITTAPDFLITSSAASQTISAGQTATYPLTIEDANGFSGTVSLACSGAPSASTCPISPNSVKLSGTNDSTATVMITTTAHSSASAEMIRRTPFPGPRLWTALACIPALACTLIGLAGRRSGLRRRAGAGISVVLFFAVLSFGCGGGSSSGAQRGTPAGTYTITVTGTSGALTHTTNLTLKVN